MKIDLLPCPFCGALPGTEKGSMGVRVRCSVCSASTAYYYHDNGDGSISDEESEGVATLEAVSHWNRRTQPKP